MSNVHIQIERKVFGIHNCRIKHQLHTLIGNQTGIYPLSATPGSRCGHFHNLVLSLAIIVSEVKTQTVIKEFHIKTSLVRGSDFRFQIVIHLHIALIRNQNTVVELITIGIYQLIGFRILTHLSSRKTQLGKSNPRRQRLVDALHKVGDNKTQVGTGIEERVVCLWQSRRPVVTGRNIE